MCTGFIFKVFAISLLSTSVFGSPRYEDLRELLGAIPKAPELQVDTLERVSLNSGFRYKIRFLAEPADTVFDTEDDSIFAYLFIPKHPPGRKLPAIIAIHQDANNRHLGKMEPAGLDSAEHYPDQKYGVELFEEGYVVICPDRFGHGERRAIPEGDTANMNPGRDSRNYIHRGAQHLMKGRTMPGKEAYDLMLSVNLLCELPMVDTTKIGAIGHSAGGYAMIYLMFLDTRVRVGVSSCGFFDLVEFYNDKNISKRSAVSVIPGLALVGSGSDYLAHVAPRPVLLTRGNGEWIGHPNGEERSREHVRNTEKMVRYAKQMYERKGKPKNLRAFYFSGGHFFTESAKKEAKKWLKEHLLGG